MNYIDMAAYYTMVLFVGVWILAAGALLFYELWKWGKRNITKNLDGELVDSYPENTTR